MEIGKFYQDRGGPDKWVYECMLVSDRQVVFRKKDSPYFITIWKADTDQFKEHIPPRTIKSWVMFKENPLTKNVESFCYTSEKSAIEIAKVYIKNGFKVLGIKELVFEEGKDFNIT